MAPVAVLAEALVPLPLLPPLTAGGVAVTGVTTTPMTSP